MQLDQLFRKKNIIDRDELHYLVKHSDINQGQINQVLEDDIYAKPKNWMSFIQILLMALGIGLIVIGVVFFFAFNWHGLHKYLKFSIIIGLILGMTSGAYHWREQKLLSNTLLTGTVMGIGALWAVFGQVYQTGANAYTFFGAWLIFGLFIAAVTKFEPLWLIVVALANATLGSYLNEVDHSLSSGSVWTMITGMNLVIWLIFNFTKDLGYLQVARWFTDVLFLYICLLSTISICSDIFDQDPVLWLNILLGILILAIGSSVAFKEKRIYQLGLLAFGTITIITCALIDFSDDEIIVLMVAFFIIISISGVSYGLYELQKSWDEHKHK